MAQIQSLMRAVINFYSFNNRNAPVVIKRVKEHDSERMCMDRLERAIFDSCDEVVAAVRSSNAPFWDQAANCLKYQQVVVTIGASGAVIVGQEANTLIFDCRGQEGDFVANYPGQMIGYNTCVLGALAAGWIENPQAPDWARSVYWGIALARFLHIKGLKVVADGKHKSLQYPYATLAQAYREWKHKALLIHPVGNTLDLGIFVDDKGLAINPKTLGNWTILERTLLTDDMLQQDYLINTRITFSGDEEVVCVVENDACGVDAVQVLTGCTLGKGNLIYRDRGKMAFSFFNRKNGDALRLMAKPFSSEMGRKELQEYILNAPVDVLFDFMNPAYSLPELARIFNSLICDSCGENTAENKMRLQDGKKVCLDCFKKYNRGW